MEKNVTNNFYYSIRTMKNNGFLFIFLSSVLNKIIGFVCTWIIVRLISKSDYGVYSYAYNIYSIILLFNGLGVSSAVLQIGSEFRSMFDKSRIYKYGLRVACYFDLILAIILIFVSLVIELPIEGSNDLLILMFGLPLFTIIPELQYMYLRIFLRNKEYSLLTSVNSIITLLLSVLLSKLYGVYGLIFSGYISHFITIVIAVVIFNVPFEFNNVLNTKEEFKSFYSISSISMANNSLSRIMYLLDIFVIGILIADSSVIASYKIATNIPTALDFIPQSLIIFVYPFFAANKDNYNWIKNSYKKIIYPFALFNIVCSIILIVFAKNIIVLIFGKQYLDAVIPFQILSGSYFFSSTFRVISGNLLITQRKLKFNFYISLTSCLFNVVFNFVFVNIWGVIGAAISTFLTVFLSGLISTIYFLSIIRKKEGEK